MVSSLRQLREDGQELLQSVVQKNIIIDDNKRLILDFLPHTIVLSKFNQIKHASNF